jgi:hypothetical protein
MTAMPVQLSIPTLEAEVPVIDGTIAPGEWEGAAVEAFADGSELLLAHSDGNLYLGFRSSTQDMIAGNVFVEHDDQIRILHASAALGTAIYLQEGDVWQRTQDFVWRCRDSSQSELAQATRDAFLQEEHWVAANSRMGAPNELEFQIELTGTTLRMAANMIRTTAPSVKVPWPANLDDDCIKPTPGGLPVQLSFSPSQWTSARISTTQ